MTFTCTRQSSRKWIAIFGMFLIMCPKGIMWYWGNMSVYVNSYIIRGINTTTTEPNVQSTWLIACFDLGSSLGLLLSGFLSQSIGDRITMVIGMVTFLLALVCSYFMIDVNGLAMEIIAGAVTGVGSYLSNGVIMKYTMQLAGDDFGYFYAIVQGGINLGPIVINQLITLYINPDNLTPDYTIGPSVYFSQDDLLDRVPRVFWIIAGCDVVCDIVGMLMVELTVGKTIHKSIVTNENTVSYGATQPEVNSGITIQDVSDTNGIASRNSDLSEVSGESSDNKSTDVTIGQAIRTPMMYICMLFIIFGMAIYAVNTMFYNTYGQLYIKDDHFLTNVSFLLLISLLISKLGWGRLLDNLPLKTVYIVFFASSGVSSQWFYISPMLNKWFYAIMSAIYTMSACPIYLISVVSCRKIFGDKYISILGLVYLPPMIIIMFTPTVFEMLLKSFGWFSIYATCCSLSLVGLIICIVIPFKGRSNKKM